MNEARGFFAAGMVSPRKEENVGAVLRAAGCYGAAFVAQSGQKKRPGCTDTMKAYRHMPFFRVENLKDIIPYGCIPVAVDLIDGAIPLQDYKHPEQAFYVFGPENGTLGRNTLDWCRDVIYIPTKRCMNLAATVNVVFYSRCFGGLR